jgi:arylsulfatase A-like enzyme
VIGGGWRSRLARTHAFTIGKVLAQIRANGQAENTLIFFFSDNGGPTPQSTSGDAPPARIQGADVGRRHPHRIPDAAEWQNLSRQSGRPPRHPARHPSPKGIPTFSKGWREA